MHRTFIHLSLHAFYVLLDTLCIFLAVFLGYGLYHLLGLGREAVYSLPVLLQFCGLLAVIIIGFMSVFGAYHRNSGLLNVLEIRAVLLAVLAGFGAVNVFFIFIRVHPSRYAIFLIFLILALLLPLLRSLLYHLLTDKMPEQLQRKVLIYGAGELGQRLFREISSSPRLGLRVAGFIDDDAARQGTRLTPCGFHTNHCVPVAGATCGTAAAHSQSRRRYDLHCHLQYQLRPAAGAAARLPAIPRNCGPGAPSV